MTCILGLFICLQTIFRTYFIQKIMSRNSVYNSAENVEDSQLDLTNNKEASRKRGKSLARCCSKFWCFCCRKAKASKERRSSRRRSGISEKGEEWDQDVNDPEEVPEEFQDWLTATFKSRSNSGPRIKALTHIKTGKRTLSASSTAGIGPVRRVIGSKTNVPEEEISRLLEDFNNWNFDLHKLHEISNGIGLRLVVKEVFRFYNITKAFSINAIKLENFLDALEHGYRTHKNPYHNDTHASEVVHSVHCFLQLSGIVRFYTDVEIFSLLFAAIIHDFEHSGKTNNYHVNAQTDLALLYNDNSVQENHHLSSAFRVLKISQCNIVSDMSTDEYREFRRLVINLVLDTDMTTHFQQLKIVRNLLKSAKWCRTDDNAIEVTMSLILHAADISNPGKCWATHRRCAQNIITEFFAQGDEEKRRGLPVTPLCDRVVTDVPRTQVTFIEVIVEPCLTVLGDMFEYIENWDLEATPSMKNRRKSRGVKKTALPYTADHSDHHGEHSTRAGSMSAQVMNDPTRPWVICLYQNKAKWIQEAADKAKNEQPQKVDK